jgi:hypothetical protein
MVSEVKVYGFFSAGKGDPHMSIGQIYMLIQLCCGPFQHQLLFQQTEIEVDIPGVNLSHYEIALQLCVLYQSRAMNFLAHVSAQSSRFCARYSTPAAL